MVNELSEIICKKCSGELKLLGTLGKRLWLKCIQCGLQETTTDFSIDEVEDYW